MTGTNDKLFFPGLDSRIIDLYPPDRDAPARASSSNDEKPRPLMRTVPLPVIPVQVVGTGKRQSELDLFEETVLRLVQAGVPTIREIHSLIGIEEPLIRSVLQSLQDQKLMKKLQRWMRMHKQNIVKQEVKHYMEVQHKM